MKRERIKEFQAGGRKLSASHLNQLVHAARRDIIGIPPIRTTEWEGGTFVSSLGEFGVFIGRVDASSKPSDFSDYRYYVRREKLGNIDSDVESQIAFSDETFPTSDAYVVANLAERDRTFQHILQPSDRVVFFPMADNSITLTKRYLMWALPETGLWGKINGRVSDVSYKWKYSWAEQSKSGLGYGGWDDKSGGRSGISDAFNTIEDINNDVGIEGNGVNVDGADFPTNFSIQPVPINTPVFLWPIRVGSDLEYWFNYENAVDGICD